MKAKSNFWLASYAFLLSILVLAGSAQLTVVSAAPPTPVQQTNLWDKIIFLANGAWQKLSGKRQAGVRQTRIAAGRGSARESELKSDIVALIPVNNGDFVGVSTTNQPTFWFYVSPTFSELSLESMKFTLRSQQNKELWSTKLSKDSLKIGDGLMPISYKGDQLTADGTYFWELSYRQADIKQGKTRVFEQKLSGNLQKVTFANLLASQKLSERVNFYARNGIWHELITELITKKQQYPHDLQIASAFRSLIFESPDVKYLTIDERKDDVALMEKITAAKVLNLSWSN